MSSKYIYFQFHFKIINSISLSILFLSHPSKIGLLLLCATGNLHVSWTIWQLLLYFFDHENTETDILIAWFIGAAGGALLGALLNANWSKILIYVSRKKPCNCLFFITMVRLLRFMNMQSEEETV